MTAHLSIDEARALLKKQKPPKYRNKKTNGYDSGREANRAQQLSLMEKNGEIDNLREQVRYALVVGHTLIAEYIADFVYINSDGDTVVEDAKGPRTRDYVMKKKLMLALYGIEVKEV